MNNFQGKKEKRLLTRVLHSNLGLFCLGIFLLLFMWSIIGFMSKMIDTAKNKKIAEEKVADLEMRKEKLLVDIDNLNTDEGKEKVFRENFGLAQEGEGLIVIVDEKNNKEIQKNSSEKGFFDFFQNLFGN